MVGRTGDASPVSRAVATPLEVTLRRARLKSNSIALSGSKLVADRFNLEPDSVMEFGRGPASSC